MALDPSIVKVKTYIMDEYLTCDIYVKDGSIPGIDEKIEKLNANVPRFERIMRYYVKSSSELLK